MVSRESAVGQEHTRLNGIDIAFVKERASAHWTTLILLFRAAGWRSVSWLQFTQSL